jgi:hypothetical protein
MTFARKGAHLVNGVNLVSVGLSFLRGSVSAIYGESNYTVKATEEQLKYPYDKTQRSNIAKPI